MKRITDKQQLVLEFIQEWQGEHGYSPSVREVAAHFQVSVNAAAQHLRSLEQKNILSRAAGKGRALTIINQEEGPTYDAHNSNPLAKDLRPPTAYTRFPLVGEIPAGAPNASYDLPDSYLDLSPEWFGRGEMMAVKVKGDSMTGDFIGDGDIAIIKKQVVANPKDIVAVRVDGSDVTLKRIKKAGDRIYLLASNKEFETKSYPADKIEIIGKLVSIIRKF